ncbi:MAG: hypothetical protein E7559_06810 [Ruminococcaceae bacterium]|nr:hypothetical protein [Oscillospiraceae bacterium]
MKIALICGSPKAKDSASEELLGMLERCFPNDGSCINFRMNRNELTQSDVASIMACDALVFAFPLYVDAIPSHMLRCLEQLEREFTERGSKDNIVYGICNCGFPEGRQCNIALDMLNVWALKSGLRWGRGVAIGGGGGLAYPVMKKVPDGAGPKKGPHDAMVHLAAEIMNGFTSSAAYKHLVTGTMGDTFSSRIFYKMGAHMGWHQMAKANGLKKKDLGKKL